MPVPDRQTIEGIRPRDLVPTPWMAEAACTGSDPDLFFGESGDPCVDAKAICGRCPVSEACLKFAIQNSERFGIWGGLTFRQRIRVKIERSQVA